MRSTFLWPVRTLKSRGNPENTNWWSWRVKKTCENAKYRHAGHLGQVQNDSEEKNSVKFFKFFPWDEAWVVWWGWVGLYQRHSVCDFIEFFKSLSCIMALQTSLQVFFCKAKMAVQTFIKAEIWINIFAETRSFYKRNFFRLKKRCSWTLEVHITFWKFKDEISKFAFQEPIWNRWKTKTQILCKICKKVFETFLNLKF